MPGSKYGTLSQPSAVLATAVIQPLGFSGNFVGERASGVGTRLFPNT